MYSGQKILWINDWANRHKRKVPVAIYGRIEGAEGVQLVIHKVSIPDILAKEYLGKRGENVEIKVKP